MRGVVCKCSLGIQSMSTCSCWPLDTTAFLPLAWLLGATRLRFNIEKGLRNGDHSCWPMDRESTYNGRREVVVADDGQQAHNRHEEYVEEECLAVEAFVVVDHIDRVVEEET